MKVTKHVGLNMANKQQEILKQFCCCSVANTTYLVANVQKKDSRSLLVLLISLTSGCKSLGTGKCNKTKKVNSKSTIHWRQIFCSAVLRPLWHWRYLSLGFCLAPFKDICSSSINIFIQYFWYTSTQNKVQRENWICTVWKIIFMYNFLLTCPMWH